MKKELTQWQTVLELNCRRAVTGGSPEALVAALGRGADLRIYTEFIHNEHIDPASDSPEIKVGIRDLCADLAILQVRKSIFFKGKVVTQCRIDLRHLSPIQAADGSQDSLPTRWAQAGVGPSLLDRDNLGAVNHPALW